MQGVTEAARPQIHPNDRKAVSSEIMGAYSPVAGSMLAFGGSRGTLRGSGTSRLRSGVLAGKYPLAETRMQTRASLPCSSMSLLIKSMIRTASRSVHVPCVPSLLESPDSAPLRRLDRDRQGLSRPQSDFINELLDPEFWLGSSIHLTVSPQNASLISREQPCRCLSTTQPRDVTDSGYHEDPRWQISTRAGSPISMCTTLKEQGERSRRQARYHFGSERAAHLLVDLHAVRAGVFIGDG